MYEINTFDYLYYIHMCVCVCVCVCVWGGGGGGGGGGGPICRHYKMKQGPTGFLCVCELRFRLWHITAAQFNELPWSGHECYYLPETSWGWDQDIPEY